MCCVHFWRTSEKEATFSLINKAFAVSRNTLRVLFVFIRLSHGSDCSVDQSTNGVCTYNFSAPFLTAWYPNGVVPNNGYHLTALHCSVETRHKTKWLLMFRLFSPLRYPTKRTETLSA